MYVRINLKYPHNEIVYQLHINTSQYSTPGRQLTPGRCRFSPGMVSPAAHTKVETAKRLVPVLQTINLNRRKLP